MLHEHRVDGGIVVELPDRAEEVGLGGVLGQVVVGRVEVELGRLLLLHADVAGTGGVVTDEHGAETGAVTVLHELGDPGPELAEHRFGDRPTRHHHRH